jgi:hypothetical protein
MSTRTARWPELRCVRPVLHAWGDAETENGAFAKRFDLILGADIIYGATDIEYVYPRLLASMERFSGPKTTVLIAYKPRHKSVSFVWKSAFVLLWPGCM